MGQIRMRRQGISPGSDYLANYRQLETTDLDCAREAVGRMWEHHRSHLLRGRTYAIAWHQADLVASTLSYVRTSSSIRLDCGPVSDAFRLTLHESGRINHWIDGRPAVSTPSRAVLHAPGQGLRLETEPFRLLILSFPADAVRDALRVHHGAGGEAVVWPTELPLGTPAAKSLRALCRWAARELDRPGAGALAGAEARRAIETTLLMLFLDCALDPPGEGKAQRQTATEARVRRVEDWIEAGFAEPVTVDHLARVAGVSVRALQNACRRWRGCTPMELLRRRRLHAAREALLEAGPTGSVTAVATGCGFFNFGRFAGDYRRRFGETPSQTLAARAAATTAFGRGRKTQPADAAFEG
jgi:AraC-like DNA-binding protein